VPRPLSRPSKSEYLKVRLMHRLFIESSLGDLTLNRLRTKSECPKALYIKEASKEWDFSFYADNY